MHFSEIISSYSWEEIGQQISSSTKREVERALSKEKLDSSDFLALISPAAAPYLELMAQKSHELTLKRFGRTMQMYVPIYLSNECTNICTYCGFSQEINIPRKTLSLEELEKEVAHLKNQGFDHVLALTGESPHHVGIEYFKSVFPLLRSAFSHVAFEVQPMSSPDYQTLIDMGLDSVVIYQECYRLSTYKKYHPKGKKSDAIHRLDTPDRLGELGIRKLGIGALLGLEDWRTESFLTLLHYAHLKKYYWKTKYSISFPRLRPSQNHDQLNSTMTDKELLQLTCAWRLYDPDLDLNLSTRESPSFRDHAFQLGYTAMSAGSNTSPGGYTSDSQELEQFSVSDERPLSEIKKMLIKNNYDPITKDWDKSFSL